MKKVLVYGLGVTGISSVKALDKLGYEVYTYDKNKKILKNLRAMTIALFLMKILENTTLF